LHFHICVEFNNNPVPILKLLWHQLEPKRFSCVLNLHIKVTGCQNYFTYVYFRLTNERLKTRTRLLASMLVC